MNSKNCQVLLASEGGKQCVMEGRIRLIAIDEDNAIPVKLCTYHMDMLGDRVLAGKEEPGGKSI